jgi:large subunit ribosomal protein L21
MKYAIIEVSGKQFWIEIGKYYDLNHIPTKTIDRSIIFNRILLVNDGTKIAIGHPYLKNGRITGKILEHRLGTKILIYKMRPKKKTRKKSGHRQLLTRVLIDNININN